MNWHVIRTGPRRAFAAKFKSKDAAMRYGRQAKAAAPLVTVALSIEPDPVARFRINRSVPRQKAARKVSINPKPRTFNARDVAGARARLVNFRGDGHIRVVKMKAPRIPDALACIGKITVLQYEAERDGELAEFRHPFKKTSRPSLCVTPDGKMALVLGGAWVFSKDGFIDR